MDCSRDVATSGAVMRRAVTAVVAATELSRSDPSRSFFDDVAIASASRFAGVETEGIVATPLVRSFERSTLLIVSPNAAAAAGESPRALLMIDWATEDRGGTAAVVAGISVLAGSEAGIVRGDFETAAVAVVATFDV